MKKRALFVGINYVGTGNQLKGCINDSNNMKTLLGSQGFTEVEQILEKDATTAGIMAGLERLVLNTVPGDVIVFHYSGHGSQLPSADEADGFEEIICPIDLDWIKKVITDKSLRDVFNKVPNGVNTTVILDCCHSGTMLNQTESLDTTKNLVAPTESDKTENSRYMKPPARVVNQLKTRSLVNWQTSKDVNASALLIAGCRANQISADAMIDGVPQGAATAALLKSITATPSISYRQLVTEMNDFMVLSKFAQRPELDGSSSLYDQKFIEPFSFTIPAAPTPAPINVSSVTNIVSSKPPNKMIIIGVAIIAIVLLFILMH